MISTLNLSYIWPGCSKTDRNILGKYINQISEKLYSKAAQKQIVVQQQQQQQ